MPIFAVGVRLDRANFCTTHALHNSCAVRRARGAWLRAKLHTHTHTHTPGIDHSQHTEHADSIKLARISVAQIFDYFFTEPVENMTRPESDAVQESHAVMDWMTGGKTQTHLDEKNPLLFPGLASDALLAQYPPFLVLEEEFDNYRTPAERLAQRLDKAGRLLEYVCYPGTSHNGGHPNTRSDLILMFDEYLKP